MDHHTPREPEGVAPGKMWMEITEKMPADYVTLCYSMLQYVTMFTRVDYHVKSCSMKIAI